MTIAEHFGFTEAELARIAFADPMLAAEMMAGVDYETGANEKERCENSLIEFLKAAWPHMGEAGVLEINWHHEVIARNLEAQARGEIRNIVCNVPPRCTKTLLCSVALPAFIWTQPEHRWAPLMGPHVRFFCLSYGATLAEEIAVKMRRLVMGDWYQRHWGDRVQIRDDQASRANFGNTKGGERLSNSIEGGVLGRGGDWQLIDDPHNTKGAESDIERAATLEAMRNLVTRVTDPRIAARLLIMQRLHPDDATNYALENWGKTRHLMLPMRFDPRRADPEDPRGYDPETGGRADDREGELLWPEVMTPAFVAQEERELTPSGSSGQLQQAPTQRGGNIIKREWWKLWPEDYPESGLLDPIFSCSVCGWHRTISGESRSEIACPACDSLATRHVPYPEFSYRLLSVDTAYGEKQENSWSAATSWGVWHDKEDAPRAMLTNAWRGRPRLRGIPDATNPSERKGLVERVYDLATRHQADVVLIEHKTRGTDLYQELERLTQEWPFQIVYTMPTKSKAIRLEATVPLFANDRVWAPDKAWAETVISEVSAAPKAQFDDLCDTVSAALSHLRNQGLLSLGEEFRRDERQKLIFRGRQDRSTIREAYEGA